MQISLLLYLLFELIPVDYLLEISESFCSVVKDFWLLDALSYDLIENNLESKRNPRSLKVGVIVFPYLLHFGVFLCLIFRWALSLPLSLLNVWFGCFIIIHWMLYCDSSDVLLWFIGCFIVIHWMFYYGTSDALFWFSRCFSTNLTDAFILI